MQAILIPVKPLHLGKQRMSRRYPASSRRVLGLTMLRDVLDVTGGFGARFVVTSDADAAAVASEMGCEVLPDEGADLNLALDAATARCIEAGASDLLILPSDVPLVSANDVARLFGCEARVVIAASRDQGTSALRRRPPDLIQTFFGPLSAQRHLLAAREAGVTTELLDLDSIRLDVDTPEDLEEVAASDLDRRTVELARRMVAGAATPASEAAVPG